MAQGHMQPTATSRAGIVDRRCAMLGLAGTLTGLGWLALGCRLPGDSSPSGSGRLATDTRQVAAFTTIELRGTGKVVVTVGPPGPVTVQADDNLLPEIEVRVEGQTLILELKRGRPSTPPVYRLSADQLAALHSAGLGDFEVPALMVPSFRTAQSGGGTISVAELRAGELDSTVAGSATLAVSGTVERLRVSVQGSARLELQSLAVRDADLTLAGSTTAVVRVSDTLRVRLLGSGSVEYAGNPRVEQEILGSGSVRRIEG